MKKTIVFIMLSLISFQIFAQTITVTGASNTNLNKTFTLCNGCGFSYTTVEPKDAGTDSYFDGPASGLPFDQYQIYRKDGIWRFARVYMLSCCSPTTVPNIVSITSNTTKPPCDWGNGLTLTGDCTTSAPSCSIGSITANTPCLGQTLYIYPGTPTGASSFTYSWTGPNGFTSTLLYPTINNATAQIEGNYTITATGSNGCTATASVQVSIGTVPPQPSAFEFSTSLVTAGQQDVYYQVPPVSGTSGIWSYSGTGVIIEQTNDFYTSIDFAPNATSGILSVVANGACGVSPPRTMNITVQTPSVKSTLILPNILTVPQLIATEIAAIASPQKGMLAFDTTNNCLKLYNGTAWVCISTN